ncbi:MAG TPA: hypothetical protein VFP90_01520 [Gemmatimonadaceae bacterium]|nr:hypothetical protein [Gemmatimonadaceae bacterium]
MKLRTLLLTLACSAGLAGSAHAQQRKEEVPKSYRPPKGMCRIWLDKVPAKQQPAPTDCPTAVRNRPPNGKVLFGDDDRDRGEKAEKREIPFLQKFREARKKP